MSAWDVWFEMRDGEIWEIKEPDGWSCVSALRNGTFRRFERKLDGNNPDDARKMYEFWSSRDDDAE